MAGQASADQEDHQAMTMEYLLIDNLASNSRKFIDAISVPGRLEFHVVGDPEQLQEIPHTELRQFEGAIVDFHLNPLTRPAYRAFSYDNPALFDAPVEITTGMGVLLYLRRYAPDMILYGETEASSKHAPFFLCAAAEWCGAEPINVLESSDTLREVFLDPGGESGHLQTWYPAMAAAIEPFRRLMDSALGHKKIVEAYDWLRCYRKCEKPRPHVQLKSEVKRILGVKHGIELRGTYIELMRVWQTELAEIVTLWGGDVSGWPDLGGKVTHATWSDNNPVLDYVGEAAYDVFFNAADVRAALTYYRTYGES